jgi:hypothetical protein
MPNFHRSHRVASGMAATFWMVGLLVLLPLEGRAQTAINSWVLNSSDAADDANVYGSINFQNTTYGVSSFTAGTTKTVGSTASATYVRRSGATSNASIWEVGSSSTTLQGTNTSTQTLGSVLASNNVLMGANDVFTNTGGSPTQANSNVERLDFYWAGGFKAVSSDGFAVFERGGGTYDSFNIAVFTGWNAVTNAPTTYGGNVVSATSGNYGANLDYDPTTAGTQSTFNYTILRFTNGDNLTPLAVNSGNTSGQGVAGVFISFADLGIAQGTTVYGYSIMAADTTKNTSSLADWTNAAFYPETTSDTVGSIDLMAFNGRRFVPEPATYGAWFLGLSTALVGWRRRRKKLSATAA